MSKRNSIEYVKPKDPSFLARFKAQACYKEGPTIDTKRQKIQVDPNDSVNERPDFEDEKPQIVVLETGDLTAEQVAIEQKRIEREVVKPADLSQPIIFKKRSSEKTDITTIKSKDKDKVLKNKSTKSANQKSKKVSSTGKLSFNVDEEDETAN